VRDTIASGKRLLSSCTLWLSILAILLFVLDQTEKEHTLQQEGPLVLQVGLTPVQRAMLFDYPDILWQLTEILARAHVRTEQELNNLPWKEKSYFLDPCPRFWQGLEELFWQDQPCSRKGNILFTKIREGEVWRLLSPSFLHANFWHLLLNLGWLWILGWRLEIALGRGVFLGLFCVLGVFSNTAQYLVGGPFFLGLSGVLAGLAGFMWSLQKKTGWTMFSVPRATFLFLLWFFGGMMLMESACFMLRLFWGIPCVFPVANTAHITGLCAGLLLGKYSLFTKKGVG